MRYLPFRPLIDLRSVWDEDWPDKRVNEGLNVYEEEGKVVVEAPMPGIDSNKVNVTYEDGVLRIFGRDEEKEENKNGKRVVHHWNRISEFEYTTYLPRPIDTKTLDAKVKNGILTVTAEVAPEAKPKEIKVRVE